MRAREIFEFVEPSNNGGYGPGDDGTGLEVWKEFDALCKSAVQRIPNVKISPVDPYEIIRSLSTTGEFKVGYQFFIEYENNGFTPRGKQVMKSNYGQGPVFYLKVVLVEVSQPEKEDGIEKYHFPPDYERWCHCEAELHCYPVRGEDKNIQKVFEFTVVGGREVYKQVKFILDIVNRCYALCQ